MPHWTLEIPEDLARGLERIAIANHKTVPEVALENLWSSVRVSTSPATVLQAMRAQPQLASDLVDELEAAIAAAQVPVRDESIFGLSSKR
jgi:hypothetical protein